jgi:hypothetical protein
MLRDQQFVRGRFPEHLDAYQNRCQYHCVRAVHADRFDRAEAAVCYAFQETSEVTAPPVQNLPGFCITRLRHGASEQVRPIPHRRGRHKVAAHGRRGPMPLNTSLPLDTLEPGRVECGVSVRPWEEKLRQVSGCLTATLPLRGSDRSWRQLRRHLLFSSTSRELKGKRGQCQRSYEQKYDCDAHVCGSAHLLDLDGNYTARCLPGFAIVQRYFLFAPVARESVGAQYQNVVTVINLHLPALASRSNRQSRCRRG